MNWPSWARRFSLGPLPPLHHFFAAPALFAAAMAARIPFFSRISETFLFCCAVRPLTKPMYFPCCCRKALSLGLLFLFCFLGALEAVGFLRDRVFPSSLRSSARR